MIAVCFLFAVVGCFCSRVVRGLLSGWGIRGTYRPKLGIPEVNTSVILRHVSGSNGLRAVVGWSSLGERVGLGILPNKEEWIRFSYKWHRLTA